MPIWSGLGSDRVSRTRASTANDARRVAITGLRSSSAIRARRGPTVRANEQIREPGHVDGFGAAIAGEQRRAAQGMHDLVGFDVGDGRDANSSVTDQLGHGSAHAKDYEWPEGVVADQAGNELDAGSGHGLNSGASHGRAESLLHLAPRPLDRGGRGKAEHDTPHIALVHDPRALCLQGNRIAEVVGGSAACRGAHGGARSKRYAVGSQQLGYLGLLEPSAIRGAGQNAVDHMTSRGPINVGCVGSASGGRCRHRA